MKQNKPTIELVHLFASIITILGIVISFVLFWMEVNQQHKDDLEDFKNDLESLNLQLNRILYDLHLIVNSDRNLLDGIPIPFIQNPILIKELSDSRIKNVSIKNQLYGINSAITIVNENIRLLNDPEFFQYPEIRENIKKNITTITDRTLMGLEMLVLDQTESYRTCLTSVQVKNIKEIDKC